MSKASSSGPRLDPGCSWSIAPPAKAQPDVRATESRQTAPTCSPDLTLTKDSGPAFTCRSIRALHNASRRGTDEYVRTAGDRLPVSRRTRLRAVPTVTGAESIRRTVHCHRRNGPDLPNRPARGRCSETTNELTAAPGGADSPTVVVEMRDTASTTSSPSSICRVARQAAWMCPSFARCGTTRLPEESSVEQLHVLPCGLVTMRPLTFSHGAVTRTDAFC